MVFAFYQAGDRVMASMVQANEAGKASTPGCHSTASGRSEYFSADPHRADPLSMLIEKEIIPRLVVAHAADVAEIGMAPVESHEMITAADVEALAMLALQVEADALLAHVEAIIDRGATVGVLLVDLLAPAARVLGQYWEDDRCDFIDVTMGLWRLQEAVNELSTRIPPDRPFAAAGRRALFASMPGDQHSFGAVVIDELFRREGWLTDRMIDARTSDLLHRAAGGWFDLIGLTISREAHIADLPSVIVALRNVSRNPHVCVMVGGWIFSANPSLATQVGADGTARDAKLALELASSLVRAREREALVPC